MSSRLDSITPSDPRAPDWPQAETASGTVVNTPESLEDDVMVTLDVLSPDQPVGPVLGWRKVEPSVWPAAGARCAVILIPQGDAWFAAWE